jgi:hypothetical protein
MEDRVREVLRHSDQLFTKQRLMADLWQTIADNFFPERADFTIQRALGDEFASHLMTSYPVLVRRSLGDAFSSMLRPAQKPWFAMITDREEREDIDASRWLERATSIQRRAMYDPRSRFSRATKEADHDFSAFGQAAITVELSSDRTNLLYRTWHLRDMAWSENGDGVIDTIYRRWKPYAKTLTDIFKGKCHSKVIELVDKAPYTEIKCLHVIVPSSQFMDVKEPWLSMHIDVENQHLMECVPVWHKKYVIPRWQTVSGSQYAYSPATVAGLPEGRLIQAMTRTLLEAGEKYTNPPMIAVQEAIRSDVAIYPGGITWVDAEYDERLGEVLRPLTTDKGGFPVGLELRQDVRDILGECFYLSKLQLPDQTGEMTAYEVSQRVQEYIRNAIPIFEPVEQEYNAALCDETFSLLFRNGAFGPYNEIPPSLRGADVRFRFESPLTENQDRLKASTYREAAQLLAETMQLDPTASANLDLHTAFRDALRATGVPAKWIATEEDAQAALQSMQEQQEQAQQLAAAQQMADVAKTGAQAEQALPE